MAVETVACTFQAQDYFRSTVKLPSFTLLSLRFLCCMWRSHFSMLNADADVSSPHPERRWWTFKCVYFQLNNVSFFPKVDEEKERESEWDYDDSIFTIMMPDDGKYRINFLDYFSTFFTMKILQAGVLRGDGSDVGRRNFWIHINFNQSFNWNFNFYIQQFFFYFLVLWWWKSFQSFRFCYHMKRWFQRVNRDGVRLTIEGEN